MNSVTLSKKPELVKKIGSRNKMVGFLVLVIVVMVVMNLMMVIFAMNIYKDYKTDDHITYVKLDPVGNWTIEREQGVQDDFYLATVNSSLYRLLGKCFSTQRATILNDWAVCRIFLSSQMDADFVNNNYLIDLGSKNIFEYINNLNTCVNCPEIKAVIKDHDHKNSIPTSFSHARGQGGKYYESIFYIDLLNVDSGNSTKVVINLTWSFMSLGDLNRLDDDKGLKNINEALVESPLGIYFIDWDIIEDKNND